VMVTASDPIGGGDGPGIPFAFSDGIAGGLPAGGGCPTADGGSAP